MDIIDAKMKLQQAIERFVAYHSPKVKAAQNNLAIAAQNSTNAFQKLKEVLSKVEQ